MRTSGTIASERQLKVAVLIKLALVDAIKKGKVIDLRLANDSVTFTRIDVSADLKAVTCYVVPFGATYNSAMRTKLSAKELLEALDKSKHGLRAWVTKNVALKYSPELRFRYDHGFENASLVEHLIQSSINDDSK